MEQKNKREILAKVTKILLITVLPFFIAYTICLILLDGEIRPLTTLLLIITSVICIVCLVLLKIHNKFIKQDMEQLDLQGIEMIQNSKYLSPGRKERYLKNYKSASFDEKTELFFEFLLEESERKAEYEEELKERGGDIK